MTDDAVLIGQTRFRDYFDDVHDFEIYLLSEKKAMDLWDEIIDKSAKSYFDLPNDSWVVTSNSIELGEWMTSYNSGDNKYISELLSASVDWDDDACVGFFVGREVAFETTWLAFVLHWDDFLAVDDDCPIVALLNGKGEKCVIIFQPIGNIIKVEEFRLKGS